MKMNDLSNYCFAVAKIHKNSKPELFAKLYKNFFNKDQSLEFFRSKFLNEKDIKSSSIKINLKCPYTFKLIKYPARGKDCSHIKFFDLDTFIDVQAYENYSWKCPICKGNAFSIIVDKYFEEVLKGCRNKEVEDIEFFDDGSFVINSKNDDKNSERKQKNEENYFSKIVNRKDDENGFLKLSNQSDRNLLNDVILIDSDDDGVILIDS